MGSYLSKIRGGQPVEPVVKAEEAQEEPGSVNDQITVKAVDNDGLIGQNGDLSEQHENGVGEEAIVSTSNGVPDEDGDATEEDELGPAGDVDTPVGDLNGVAALNGHENGHNGHSELPEYTNGNGHHNGSGDAAADLANVVGLGSFDYEESIDDSESGHDLRHETASQASVSERSDRSASKSLDYTCAREGCGHVFHYKKHLKQHEKEHRIRESEIAKRDKIQASLPLNSLYNPEKDRPFVCTQTGCDWSFKQLSHLKRHAGTHADQATPAKRPMTYANVLASSEVIDSPPHPIIE